MKFNFPNKDRNHIELLASDGVVIESWHSSPSSSASEQAITDLTGLFNDAPWWLTIGVMSNFKDSPR